MGVKLIILKPEVNMTPAGGGSTGPLPTTMHMGGPGNDVLSQRSHATIFPVAPEPAKIPAPPTKLMAARSHAMKNNYFAARMLWFAQPGRG